jgi:NhaA family Na+:H+ antiporter
MATDIAFAVAVVTSLGSRVPLGGRLFLLTLAIVDDLGAILVIAIFYTADLRVGWLGIALVAVLLAAACNRARVRALFPYLVLGVVGWFAPHESGVHATLIGVIFGVLTPAHALLPATQYPAVAGRLVDEVVDRNTDGVVSIDEQEANEHTLREIRRLSLETQSPLHRLERRLAPYVAFGIVPLFAFANAGITLPEVPLGEWLSDTVTLGVAVGLVVGKTLGIFSAAWIAVRFGLSMPPGVNHLCLLGLSAAGGIGFTVALFVTNLAFADVEAAEMARLGVMVGSVVAAVSAYTVLRCMRPEPAS